MEKIEIVKEFLKDKIQLQPEALDYLYENQSLIKEIFERAKEMNIRFLTLEKIRELTTSDIRIVEPIPLKQFSVNDLKNYLEKRFDFLSKILERKLPNPISISKIGEGSKTFSLIGIVKDKDGYVVIEDKTGKISLNIKKEHLDQIFLDEVIGVECELIKKEVYVKRLVFPGVPVFRPINTVDKDVVISKKAILLGDDKKPINLERVLWIVIKNFKALLLTSEVVEPYRAESEPLIETMIKLVEKRHLNPTIVYERRIYQEDPYLLVEIPDVIAVFGAELSKKNYKGTTIFTLPNDCGVNLKTRESIKIV